MNQYHKDGTPVQYTIGSDLPSWNLIPAHMIGIVRRYIEHGVEPGNFLEAMLTNDLRGACYYADTTNRHAIFNYVMFFHNYAPSECWGSKQRFEAWMKQKGLNWPID